MKEIQHLPQRNEPKARSLPLSVALLLIIAAINVAATVLSLLLA